MVLLNSDAKGMATGVHEALAEMLVEYGNMEKMEAIRTLTTWITEKRYLRDLVRYLLLRAFIWLSIKANELGNFTVGINVIIDLSQH